MIASILLLPSQAHREALLAPGPCGAGAPRLTMHVHRDGARHWHHGCSEPYLARECDVALVLAHDGQVVREGIDRWWYVGRADRGERWYFRHPSEWATSPAEVLDGVGDGRGLGTVILLDSDGREVG